MARRKMQKLPVGCNEFTHRRLMASAALAIALLSRPAAAAAQTAESEPTSSEPSPSSPSVSPEPSAQPTTATNVQENVTEQKALLEQFVY